MTLVKPTYFFIEILIKTEANLNEIVHQDPDKHCRTKEANISLKEMELKITTLMKHEEMMSGNMSKELFYF